MKNFIIIGVGGFVAERHLKAIKETGNNLVAAYDIIDSVGILDSYFPDALFFNELEQLNTFLLQYMAEGNVIDYCTICTPNYLHVHHILYALQLGIHVICEKPLVLTPKDAIAIENMANEKKRTINTVLQLRLHPAIQQLQQSVREAEHIMHDVTLQYISCRGDWYDKSWKGNKSKSGGIIHNIGIHFLDMLTWIFGAAKKIELYEYNDRTAIGKLHLQRATVHWTLSISQDMLPEAIRALGAKTFRQLSIDNALFEFSDGFTNLHTESYKAILAGKGFGVQDALPAIMLADSIINQASQL